MRERAFTAYGQPLALNPQAFGMIVFEAEAPETRDAGNGVHVIDVRGPLMHHADPFCDSYDAIKSRVVAALDAGATTVVLSIDSPGGLVSGCFDTSDEIRAACDSRGATLVAYVDGQATSAAYALACVAEKIFVPSTGIVGSIGVIDGLIDATAQDAAIGLQYTLITSGARKSDGNPHAKTTDGAVVASQARVNALASIFFDHVSARRGIAPDALAGLQAGLFHGADAVSRGLADQIATLDQVLQLAAAGGISNAAPAAQTPEVVMNDDEKARAALQAIIDGDGDDKAKSKAKAALAALDASDEKEPDGDEAEGDGEPDGDESEKKKDEEAKASAQATAQAAEESRLDRIERRQIMASRPDLTDTQRAALASVPVVALEAALRAIPRAVAKPAATATVQPTRGEGQTEKPAKPAIAPNADLDRAFGLAKAEAPIRRDGHRTYFGVLTREQAASITAEHDGGAK